MKSRFAIAFLVLLNSLWTTDALAAFGRTLGTPNVSSTGSAQYSIPIWTPPGINGLQPHLALVYDSHASYGIMGPGWNLSGLSTISRCNRTYAQDATPAAITLTYADAFCLDGNRLRLTSSETLSTYGQGGTTYQTEIANFSNVIASSTLAGNGPAYFTVQGKDGLTYEYGNGRGSQILAPGGITPYGWALDKVTDRAGNTMIFNYTTAAQGGFTLTSIQYTAPSGSTTYPYKVSFTYTTKSANDQISKVIAATQVVQTQQLGTITVTSSGTIVRQYNLAYTTSADTLRATLTSIQECGGSAGTDCLAPTSVSYQQGTAGVAIPATSTGSGTTTGLVYTADIDGDGKQDIVFARLVGTTLQWWVQFATASGFAAPINTGAVSVNSSVAPGDFLVDSFDGTGSNQILAVVGGIWNAYRWNGSTFVVTSTGIPFAGTSSYSTADVDGDGRPDLVSLVSPGAPTPATITVRLNTSTAGAISFSLSTVSQSLPGTIRSMQGNNQIQRSSVKHFDFDGDGRQDLIVYSSKTGITDVIGPSELLSRYPAPFVFSSTIITGVVGGGALPVNWNDDACTDLIVGAVLYVSQCNGSFGSTYTFAVAPIMALDWDGDGRTDVIADSVAPCLTCAGVTPMWQVFQSLGGTTPAPPVTITPATTNYIGTVADISGDGLDDIIVTDNTVNYGLIYGLHNGAGVKPDLATSITDGYGNSFSPTYVSIAQNNYTEYTDAVFPYQNYIGPFYVVSQAVYSDPSNMPSGTYNRQFYYYGAWTNLQGRGFQSFYATRSLDSRNNLYDVDYYQRSFPETGMEFQYFKDMASNGSFHLSQYNWTPTYTTLDSTASNQRYFPYQSALTQYQKEVGGSENSNLITTTQTNYTYDNYGNATTVATVITDNDPGSGNTNSTWTTTTVNTISPNTSTWCLGLPTQTQVTKSSTAFWAGPAITRTVTFTPDYTNCRETQKVTEPTSAIYKVTEGFTFDSFGNIATDTVTGIGMTPRVATLNWGSTGQFLTTITNPLSQVVTMGHDPNTGNLTSQTDPNSIAANPLATTWQYDNFNRKTLESRPDGTSTSWSYNNCATNGCVNTNNKMTITQTVLNVGGSTQKVTNTYTDAVDRALITSSTMLSGSYDRSETQYDNLGRVYRQGEPCVFGTCTASTTYWTTNTYDVLDRLTQSQRPVSASNSTLQTTTYGYAGRHITTTDALNISKDRQYLVTGELYSSQDQPPPYYFQVFNYDVFGSLTKVSDSANNTLFTATYAYGINAFQILMTDMDSGARTYTVDALGEITAYSDAKSQNFSTNYDALSRPLVRIEPDLTTTWTWGNSAVSYNIGKLASLSAVGSNGTHIEASAYDSKTRPSTKTITIPGDATYTYTYTYNATTGFLDTMQYPVSPTSPQLKLQYAYASGIMQSITDFNTPTTVYWKANATNARGQITQETLGNGVITNRSIDAVTGWPGSIQSGVGGGAALQNFAATYDYDGNVTQRQDSNRGLTENFYYDGLNRLDHSTLNGMQNLKMTYDAAGMGNIASRSDVNGGAAWTYDPVRKHAVITAGSAGYLFAYDANGNTTTHYAVAGNTWTSFNQPNFITNGGQSLTYSYDGNHQRYKQIYSSGPGDITYFIGKELEKVYNTSGVYDYRHYIFAGDKRVALVSRLATGVNTTYYFLGDHISSTTSILNSNGTDYVDANFSAYGAGRDPATWNSPIPNRTPFYLTTLDLFTGQQTHLLMNLVNLNGRMLDAVTGRMMSADPYVPDPENTQDFNRYSYVDNNPLTSVDPSGYYGCGGFDTTSTYVPGSGTNFTVGPDGNLTEGTVTAGSWVTTVVFRGFKNCHPIPNPHPTPKPKNPKPKDPKPKVPVPDPKKPCDGGPTVNLTSQQGVFVKADVQTPAGIKVGIDVNLFAYTQPSNGEPYISHGLGVQLGYGPLTIGFSWQQRSYNGGLSFDSSEDNFSVGKLQGSNDALTYEYSPPQAFSGVTVSGNIATKCPGQP
jgi:RHS repeat-associated protein